METPIKTYRDLYKAAESKGKLDERIQIMYLDLGADQFLPLRMGTDEFISESDSALLVSI